MNETRVFLVTLRNPGTGDVRSVILTGHERGKAENVALETFGEHDWQVLNSQYICHTDEQDIWLEV